MLQPASTGLAWSMPIESGRNVAHLFRQICSKESLKFTIIWRVVGRRALKSAMKQMEEESTFIKLPSVNEAGL